MSALSARLTVDIIPAAIRKAHLDHDDAIVLIEAACENAVVGFLRELAKGGTAVLWMHRFGTAMIRAHDLRALAEEIEGESD
jgi:hypothetical protein